MNATHALLDVCICVANGCTYIQMDTVIDNRNNVGAHTKKHNEKEDKEKSAKKTAQTICVQCLLLLRSCSCIWKCNVVFAQCVAFSCDRDVCSSD